MNRNEPETVGDARSMRRVRAVVLAAAMLTLTAGAGAATWQGGANVWDGQPTSGNSNWNGGTPPAGGDAVNLTQSTAGGFTITYDASASINRDDGDTGNDQRFGTLELENPGGGTTDLLVDGSADELASSAFNIRGGGKLDMDAGLVNASGHVRLLSGGTISQSGGRIETDSKSRDLLAHDGTYEMTGGRGEFRTLRIGTSSGNAVVNVSGGAVLRGGTITGYVVGGGSGTGELNVQTNGKVGGIDSGGKGEFIIRPGGTVNVTGGQVGDNLGGQTQPKRLKMAGGELNLSSGSFSTRFDHTIGRAAGQTATVNVSGGTYNAISPQGLYLGRTGGSGASAGGVAIFNHTGGTVQISGSPHDPGLIVGHANGTQESIYTFKDATHGGKWTLETRASGTFRGYGKVDGNSKVWIDNSGRIVANGFGQERALDLTDFRDTFNAGNGEVQNLNDNPADGDNGYFATDGGELVLPSYTGANASAGSAFNWGEPQSDTSIDLINSARVEFTNFSGNHALVGSLLDPARSDVQPGAPELISVHDLSLTNADGAFDDFDLTIRYDHTALGPGDEESQLRLLHFDGANWVDVTSSRDTTNNLITANDLTSFSQFGVTTTIPEPGSLALLAPAGLLLIRRRR